MALGLLQSLPNRLPSIIRSQCLLSYVVVVWQLKSENHYISYLLWSNLKFCICYCAIFIRVGTAECLQHLRDSDVPVLVFSAGIGDVVKSCLEHQDFLTRNVHVVSNFLKFHDGIVAGCQGDIIHIFNKNEHLIQNTPYYEVCKFGN